MFNLFFIIIIGVLYSDNVGSINVITTNDIHGFIGEQDAQFLNPGVRTHEGKRRWRPRAERPQWS